MAGCLAILATGWCRWPAAEHWLAGGLPVPTTFVSGRDGRAIALAIGPCDWASAPAPAIIEALVAAAAPHPGLR